MRILPLFTGLMMTTLPLAALAGVVEVPVDEGAYRVTLALTGAPGGSDVTVQAESRRAVLGHLRVPEGEQVEKTFTVWRLSDRFEDGSTIRLTEREIGIGTYDGNLRLEINGTRPMLESLRIEPAGDDVTTVFLAGDSTVTDQPNEPWSSWGAMLPMYFDERVAVANFASSGRALRSFRAERRFEKLLSLLKEGDYVFIQFGHNDQKEEGEGIGAFESYTDDLQDYIEQIRAKGGRPVLVTSMVRRRFDSEGRWFETLGDYPEAVRQVAAGNDVPLIDLHAMSRQIVEALGVEESKRMFVHYPANTFPGQDEALRDDSHFNTYGGDLLARAVIVGISEHLPELAGHLRDRETSIDPRHPESFGDWDWPETPACRE